MYTHYAYSQFSIACDAVFASGEVLLFVIATTYSRFSSVLSALSAVVKQIPSSSSFLVVLFFCLPHRKKSCILKLTTIAKYQCIFLFNFVQYFVFFLFGCFFWSRCAYLVLCFFWDLVRSFLFFSQDSER